jgi:predicted ATPase/DNA-binding SARP family transcriptional activator
VNPVRLEQRTTDPALGELCLLGAPRWAEAQGGNETPLAHGPSLWLLAYLMVQDAWVDRGELAELLWSEVSAQDARNNLRQALHRAKTAPWFASLETTPQALRFTRDSDLSRFRRAVERADWQAALAAYTGPLLEELHPSGVFGSWLEAERSALQNDWRAALTGRVNDLESQSDVKELPGLLERLLETDPYNEEALHSLLKLASRAGTQAAALRQFETFKARLRSDLGAEAHPETVRLAAQLSGAPVPAQAAALELVGRETQLAELLERLQLGTTRLLTLRGPGGVGKTALAERTLKEARGFFADGATWISLRGISNLGDVPGALATALELTLQAEPSAWAQITETLQHRHALLILDNAEHLRGLAERVADLLEETQRLTVLTTSRESLGLPGEWVLPISGLEYPSAPDLELARASAAVQLFVSRAGRRRGGFALTRETLPGILRVCAAVDGLPLGIELAAAWATELSPEALADGLEAGAELLESGDLELPEAHRSLRTVFEHSWELLEDELRVALCTLSVFRGGFERRAALEGVGVSARALLGLVGRSLVSSLPGGRYDLHAVVQRVYLDHARFFAQLSQQAELPLRGGATQTRWLARLTTDHQNLLAALRWTSTSADTKIGAGIVGHLEDYWYTRGHYQEGLHWASVFLELHQQPDATRLKLLWTRTSLTKEFAQYEAAHLSLLEYRALAVQLEDQSAQAGAIMLSGMLERERGHINEAKVLLLEAETMWKQLGDQYHLASCLNALGAVEAMQSHWEAAKERFEQSLELKRALGDQQGIAYALANLGNIAGSTGDFAVEKTLQEESLLLKRELGNVLGIASGLSSLGANALDQHQIAPAKAYLSEALELFMRFGKRNASVVMLDNFSRIAQKCHVYPDAIILAAAADHLTELIGSYKFDHWEQNHRDLQTQSGLSAAELSALETQGKNLSLAEAAEFALTRQQRWLELDVGVSRWAS